MPDRGGSRPRPTRHDGGVRRRGAPRKHADETLSADLAALRELSHEALKQRWRDLYGAACPTRMSRVLLLVPVVAPPR